MTRCMEKTTRRSVGRTNRANCILRKEWSRAGERTQGNRRVKSLTGADMLPFNCSFDKTFMFVTQPAR
ncbi:hypothetical protein ANANG_G00248860 [Anguilla anguilla]|uniref:Uncharacterized protein n=1 Tax=Anguilla anguilla TaxID=7936 RepID=A0A9D3LT12_ANGAN|nr:hypothetical protein ANANG_G00248860 [Anguilla anguilla]